MSGAKSPVLPEVSEPLDFKIEWLTPFVNDIHSRSRVQSILLNYLRVATGHLQTHFPPSSRPTDNNHWRRFMETLKMLTALEILQAPSLRAALASLWVAYLRSGGSISTIVTGATWLLEQLRPLQTQSQACVFAECAALVFVEFRKSLLPLAHDCATHLIRFCQSYSSNGALATVASEGLVALTKEGAVFLEKLSSIVFAKVCLPLLECASSRLRINGALLLVNLLRTGMALGGGTRKTAKASASRMLGSVVREERQAAVQLLAAIISFSPPPPTAAPSERAACPTASPAKIFDSWVKLSDKYGSVISAEPLCSVLIQAMILVGWNDEFIDLLLRQHSLSFSIIPETKRRLWQVPRTYLCFILERLPEVGGDLGEIATKLFKTPVNEEYSLLIREWYLGLVIDGMLRLPESELLTLPIQFSMIRTTLVDQAMCASMSDDPALSLRTILSLFAQLKGDQMLILSGDNSVTPAILRSVASSLAALLRAGGSKSAFPAGLYRPLDQISQIKTWCMAQERDSCFDAALWEILASLYSLGLISGKELIAKLADRPPVPSQRQPEDETVELDLGPVYFIQAALCSSDSLASEMVTMTVFVTEQWRLAARIPDERLVECIKPLSFLAQATLQLGKRQADTHVVEVASTVAARIICNVPMDATGNSRDANASSATLLSASRDILVHHFRSCSSSAVKFYLSQLNIFSRSPSMRKGIFYTAVRLLDAIQLTPLSQEDVEFVVDTFKDLLFPFVWETDDLLQALGAASLGRLVRMVGKRAFRDGMLQELIDRSLNETKDHHRRGYILGMAEVYAAVPENGSHLDIKLIIGLLCSLARDPRSLLVQATAIEAMHKVLDARSNSFTVILTGDIVYLVWQIYMSDHNAGSSTTLDGAVERILLSPIARTLLVLLEMLGPEINDPGTIPRICRLLVGEFMEYANFEMCEFGGPEEESLMGLFFDAVLQMLLVRQHQFSDDIPSLLRLIRTTIQGKKSVAVPKALGCLRWLLQFHPQAVLDQGVSLSQSLLMVGPGISGDGQVCLRQLFDVTFVSHAALWLEWALHAQVFKTKSTRTPMADMATPVSLQKDSALLQDEDAAGIFSPSASSVSALASGGGNIPQISRSSLLELVALVTLWLEPAVHKTSLADIFEASCLTTVVDSIIRLSMALLMLPAGVAEGGVQELKLAAIKLVSALIRRSHSLPDPVDSGSFLLDTFQSQLVAIFSTASQREQVDAIDLLVVVRALCALFDLLPTIDKLKLSHHAKLALLTKRAMSLLVIPLDEWATEQLSLYGRISLICSLLGRGPRLTTEEVAETRKQAELLHSAIVAELLHETPLDQSICDALPSLLAHLEQPNALSYTLLLSKASIHASNYWAAILRAAGSDQPQSHIVYLTSRLVSDEQPDTALALSMIRAVPLPTSIPLGDLVLRRALAILTAPTEGCLVLGEQDLVGLLSLAPAFWPSVFLVLSRFWPGIGRDALARALSQCVCVEKGTKAPLSDDQLGDLITLLQNGWSGQEYLQLILAMAQCSAHPIPSFLINEATSVLMSGFESYPEEAFSMWVSFCTFGTTREIALHSTLGVVQSDRVGMVPLEVLTVLPASTIRDCLAALVQL